MGHPIGFIGLGKMGRNMVLHLLEQGVSVVAFNRTQQVADDFYTEYQALKSHSNTAGILTVAKTPKELIDALPAKPIARIIFLMVPNGDPVDTMIAQLKSAGLTKADTLIDGGNCFYKDSMRRARELAEDSITFLDCGTSGGLEGARTGACLMLGGDSLAVQNLSWLWDALAISGGWKHFGVSGSGHFVKMVHNGVEYGIDQAIGEGFEVLAKSPFQLDLGAVADNWNHGSVVRSWLVELLGRALAKDPGLAGRAGVIGGGETGTWAQEAVAEHGANAPVLEAAIQVRKESKTKQSFATKVVSALRFEYGGHDEK